MDADRLGASPRGRYSVRAGILRNVTRGLDLVLGFDSTLIEPPDETRPLVRVHWPQRPTTAAATHYPAVAAAIVRIIAESATALARHKAGGL